MGIRINVCGHRFGMDQEGLTNPLSGKVDSLSLGANAYRDVPRNGHCCSNSSTRYVVLASTLDRCAEAAFN